MSEWKDRDNPDTIILFDVDGTLTPARMFISPEMKDLLLEAKKKYITGFVGGSDLKKQKEQLGDDCLDVFDFCFSENGLSSYKKGKSIHRRSFVDYLGEDNYQKLCNFILKYLSEVNLPMKRGTFIELRTGLLNVAPPGRSCTVEERNHYEAYDREHKVREKLVAAVKREFQSYNLACSLGGQISVDIFPVGWDKTYSMRHLEGEGFKEIHFFGNKYEPGGNDYEMMTHEKVIGHKVDSPEDTYRVLSELINKSRT